MELSYYLKAPDILETDKEHSLTDTMLNIQVVKFFGETFHLHIEKEMWEALIEISSNENCSVNDICALIFFKKMPNLSMASAIRVFIMNYYKEAATVRGHHLAGHGSFERMKSAAGLPSNFDPNSPTILSC